MSALVDATKQLADSFTFLGHIWKSAQHTKTTKLHAHLIHRCHCPTVVSFYFLCILVPWIPTCQRSAVKLKSTTRTLAASLITPLCIMLEPHFLFIYSPPLYGLPVTCQMIDRQEKLVAVLPYWLILLYYVETLLLIIS